MSERTVKRICLMLPLIALFVSGSLVGQQYYRLSSLKSQTVKAEAEADRLLPLAQAASKGKAVVAKDDHDHDHEGHDHE